MEKCEHRFSIIIPVYNSEKVISQTLKSICDQKMNPHLFEVLIINDGSTDNSVQVCQQYHERLPHMRIINQTNKGVSNARNQGIKVATGKYLLFLDSDDRISAETLTSIFKFFEEQYDKIDLVTYPLFYIKQGETIPHKRNKYFKDSGVYSIDKYPFIAQTTINVCTKNLFERNLLFDETMSLAEDEEYNLRLISVKNKIGFVSNASYYYQKHKNQISSDRNHPFYSWDIYYKRLQFLKAKYLTKTIPVQRYVQGLILYTLSWRIKRDLLSPYHLEGKTLKLWEKNLADVLRLIPEEMVIKCPYLNNKIRLYILNLQKIELKLLETANEIKFSTNRNIIFGTNNIKLEVTKIYLDQNQLHISGLITSPVQYLKDHELFLCDDSGERTRFEVCESSSCDISTRYKAKNLRYFSLTTVITEGSYMIQFKTQGNFFRTNLKYKPFLQGTNQVKMYTTTHKVLSYNSHGFRIYKVSPSKYLLKKIKNHIKVLPRSPKAFLLRLALFFIPDDIILYYGNSDFTSKIYKAFLQSTLKMKRINRYYVLNSTKENDISLSKKISNRNLLDSSSLLYKLYFIKAKTLITSEPDFNTYSPFQRGLRYYQDLRRTEVIYLPNQISSSPIPESLHKENSEIKKIVINSTFEERNLTTHYHYSTSDLIKNQLAPSKETNKEHRKIFLELSNRKYLEQLHLEKKLPCSPATFFISHYFKEIDEFLKNPNLHNFLKRKGLRLDIKVPEQYARFFDTNQERIKIITKPDDSVNYSLYITDFQPKQFDFAYRRTPIIYFMPDYKEFLAGLHNFRTLDLPFKEGFGPLATTQTELFENIQKIADNSFKLPKEYTNNFDIFFIDKKRRKSATPPNLIKK